MNAEAEQLQVRALSAVLPVCLKMLDTAGGEPYVTTYEPVLPLSRPTTSTQAAESASAADIVQQSQHSRCGSGFSEGIMRWCTLLRALKATMMAQYRHASRFEGCAHPPGPPTSAQQLST